MKPETKMYKELDQHHREKIIEDARRIAYDFKRWGFKLNICLLHPHKGWAKMTPEQVYHPEIYNLDLNDECVAANMYITDLRKLHLAAKRYRHANGVKKLRENIKDVINDK